MKAEVRQNISLMRQRSAELCRRSHDLREQSARVMSYLGEVEWMINAQLARSSVLRGRLDRTTKFRDNG